MAQELSGKRIAVLAGRPRSGGRQGLGHQPQAGRSPGVPREGDRAVSWRHGRVIRACHIGRSVWAQDPLTPEPPVRPPGQPEPEFPPPAPLEPEIPPPPGHPPRPTPPPMRDPTVWLMR